MRLFADGIIVYSETDTPADHLAREPDLSKLHHRTERWQMEFKVSQCAVLSVTTKRKPSTYDYFVDDQHIPRIDKQDYLGITINSKLSWQPHVNNVKNQIRNTA